MQMSNRYPILTPLMVDARGPDEKCTSSRSREHHRLFFMSGRSIVAFPKGGGVYMKLGSTLYTHSLRIH